MLRRDGRKRLRKPNAANPHDEALRFLKIKSKCGGHCADEGKCSAKVTPACSKSAIGSSSIEDASQDDQASEPLIDYKEAAPFYTVFAMSGVSSPDESRYMLEDTFDTLSFEFREHPTLPSDSADKTKAVSGALDNDKASVLPSKHCAFTS